jgi:hypothetical protein
MPTDENKDSCSGKTKIARRSAKMLAKHKTSGTVKNQSKLATKKAPRKKG